MNTQRRRLDATTNSNTSIQSNTADAVEITFDETNKTNVHGLRWCFSIEPENADANANGFYCIYCLPSNAITNSLLPNTFGEVSDDTDWGPYLWGIGCWTASNQAPYHYEFNPATSRNCQKNARIYAYVVKTGISAGAVRINQTLSAFTN